MSTACDVKRAPNINCGARRPRLPSMGNVNRINPGSTPCRSAPAPRPRGPCRVAVLRCLKAFEACTGSSVGNRGGGATSASATRAAARPAKGSGGFFVAHPPPRGVAQRKSTGFQTRRLQVRILSPLLDMSRSRPAALLLLNSTADGMSTTPAGAPPRRPGDTSGTRELADPLALGARDTGFDSPVPDFAGWFSPSARAVGAIGSSPGSQPGGYGFESRTAYVGPTRDHPRGCSAARKRVTSPW